MTNHTSLVSRHFYVSFPCGAQLPPFVLVKALEGNVTPGFFHIWGLVWHGVIGWLLIFGHGWVNDVLMQDEEPEGEVAEIRRCTYALTEAAGGRPVGWTSPGSRGHSCAPQAISGTATMPAMICRSCVTLSMAQWS